MPIATKNIKDNVSAAKGVDGGYCFRAEVGTELPKDLDWTPDDKWTCMGYISDDGVEFDTDADVEEFNDMNGEPVEESESKHTETFGVKFLEKKAAVLETQYGKAQVTDENGMITCHINGKDRDHFTYVFLFLLKNGRKWTRICEDAKVNELDTEQAVSSELAGRKATFKAFKGATTGDYFTDYIESTETEKTEIVGE